MNYIISESDDQIINVKSKNNSSLDLSLINSLYLAKNIKCSIRLKHESGEYLIDKYGEVLTRSGKRT